MTGCEIVIANYETEHQVL